MYKEFSKMINLLKEIKKLLSQIPKGKITTYKELAKALGDENLFRFIARALPLNDELQKYPCFKVIESDGSLGGYILGKKEKIKRLKKEGIEVKNEKVINFKKILFKEFKTDYPLKKLQKFQKELSRKIRIEKFHLKENLLAGAFDVSFQGREAFVCGLVMDGKFQIKEIHQEKMKVSFPYLPGYLCFREGPLIIKLFKKFKKKPDFLFLDGCGINHPRFLGLASFVGVMLDFPTIGISKRNLCAKFFPPLKKGDFSYLYFKGKKVGIAFLSKENTRPIFISPGHKMEIQSAFTLTKKFILKSKLPEPLKIVDQLSKKFSKK